MSLNYELIIYQNHIKYYNKKICYTFLYQSLICSPDPVDHWTTGSKFCFYYYIVF